MEIRNGEQKMASRGTSSARRSCDLTAWFQQGQQAVSAFAGAFGAFDAEHVELAFDVAEDEIDAGHCEEKAPHRGGA
jgi:hypothetical protein